MCSTGRQMISRSGCVRVQARSFQFIEQVEQIPLTDPVAVVTPGIVAAGLGSGQACAVAAHAIAIAEDLDVVADHDRQTFAARPSEIGTFGQGAVIIAPVMGQLEQAHARTSASGPSASL